MLAPSVSHTLAELSHLVDVDRRDGAVLLVHGLGLCGQVELPAADVDLVVTHGFQVHLDLHAPASKFRESLAAFKLDHLCVATTTHLDGISHPGRLSGRLPPWTGVRRVRRASAAAAAKRKTIAAILSIL